MQNPSIKYILKLSIPIFFANLAIPFVGIIDTGLMGNLGNLSYLSATSVAANLFSMIFLEFWFLKNGYRWFSLTSARKERLFRNI